MVVIAIIGILSTIALFALNSAKEKARFARAKSFEATIKRALALDLAGEWKLDEGNGEKAYDTSGYDVTGTVDGNRVWYSGDSCVSGSCLSFDGNGDSLKMNNTNHLDITSDLTISFWVWRRNNGVQEALIRKYDTANGYGIYVNSADKLTFVIGDGTLKETKTASTMSSSNKWYHVWATHKSGEQKIYLDGTELTLEAGGSFSTDPVSSNEKLWAGKPLGATPDFNGILDELRIYNAAPET